MILERIYQTGHVPEGSNVLHVWQLRRELRWRLESKICTEYLWLAVNMGAVNAGMHGARRRIRQRKRLLVAFNACREFLGQSPLELPDGWEEVNLFYGCCAVQKYAEQTGMSEEDIVSLGMFDAMIGNGKPVLDVIRRVFKDELSHPSGIGF